MREISKLIVLTAFMASGIVPAAAADSGDAAAGEKIAKQFCAACHMRPGGPISLPGKPPVPDFKDVAARDGFSAETVSAIMANPAHPYRLKKLNEQEIADVAAFVATLR